MKTYQVLFSFMSPREGYMPVEAASEEDARKIVMDLMAKNYKDFTIASITESNTPVVTTNESVH